MLNLLNRVDKIDTKRRICKFAKKVMYGFFQSIKFSFNNSWFNFSVIARKEIHNLGTRYNTRGLNSNAYVGNFVEIEQILENLSLSTINKPVLSSYVQVRGSVPVFWRQNIKLLVPKPIIEVDPNLNSQLGMRIHFIHLLKRYGKHLKILNLLCQTQNYLQKKSECDLSTFFSAQIQKEIKREIPTTENFEIDLKNLMQVNKDSLFENLAIIFSKTKENIGSFVINYFTNSFSPAAEESKCTSSKEFNRFKDSLVKNDIYINSHSIKSQVISDTSSKQLSPADRDSGSFKFPSILVNIQIRLVERFQRLILLKDLMIKKRNIEMKKKVQMIG